MKTSLIIRSFSAVILVLFAVILTGCDKEEVMHHKQAGVWEISSITTTWYDGGSADSTTVVESAGFLKLWDNHSKTGNIAEYEFSAPAPVSIYEIADGSSGLDPQGGTCWWYAGSGSTDRLTLWIDSPGVDVFVIYTVSELSRDKMELTYVRTDGQGRMSYKEVWQLTAY